MTTAQILSLSRTKLLEKGVEILTDETILIYANLAQDDLEKRAFPNNAIKTATVTFASGTGTLPGDFGTLYGDPKIDAFNIFPELSIADFSRLTSGNGVTVQGGVMKVFPTTTVSLVIQYYPIFADMSSIVNPTIDPYFHELIVYGIMVRALEDLQDEELSKYYNDKYETEFKKKHEAFSNYEEESQRGGVMFNEIGIITNQGTAQSFF